VVHPAPGVRVLRPVWRPALLRGRDLIVVAKKSACGLALSCVLLGVPPAAADDVHLDNGEVIEGRATRSGDKVVIELESGQITLHATSVKQIDKRESSVERFDIMYSALKPGDVAKRMQLADFCREHDMRERERKLLEEVIAREPDHAEARARLGYVKSSESQRWLTQAEHMREQGRVQRDGQWMSPEQALEYDRMQAARASAAAQTELEAKKVELERQKLALEKQRLEQDARERPQPPVVGYYGYGSGYGYSPRSVPVIGHTHGTRSNAFSGPHYPINGVRDPRDNTWSLPGTRNPRDGLP
jgi:hypothetical protein